MSQAGFEGEIQRALQLGAPVSGVLIIFAHIFFIGADLGFAQANFGQLVRYRLASAVFFALLTALCFTRWGRRYRSIRSLSMAIICLCAVSVSNLTTMTGGSVSPYWTMIMLTYFGGTLILRLSPLEAGLAYGVAFAYHVANMLVVAGDNPQSPEFYTNIFGLLLALLVSLTGNWYIRNLQRSEYETRQSLAEANEKLQHSITELQYKRQQEQLRYLQNKLDLANDLHDSVGAKLSQIAVIADSDYIDDTRPLKGLSSSVLENVRNFAHILKGEERVATLKTQLTRLAESLRTLGRYEVTLAMPEDDIRLSDITLLNLDRILSEWTANAIRHARATQFALGVRSRRGRLTICFYQNRTPFSWRGKAERGGLRSIATRAQNINASVSVKPYKGGSLFVLRLKPNVQPAAI
ncbi:MAG: hypothetical protein OHK0011_15400 [Turneriella sp.]